ncbi:hypothetical protein VNO78_11356 [Psophocarpus tetragonolobus]|uniref:Uncharacterized protein n=1 Tax=Psophocarpus tetragonolobus TaxID=3891 RepID=A0AAN9SM63_PSOTE
MKLKGTSNKHRNWRWLSYIDQKTYGQPPNIVQHYVSMHQHKQMNMYTFSLSIFKLNQPYNTILGHTDTLGFNALVKEQS